jgi:hypothetical protein
MKPLPDVVRLSALVVLVTLPPYWWLRLAIAGGVLVIWNARQQRQVRTRNTIPIETVELHVTATRTTVDHVRPSDTPPPWSPALDS